MHEFFRPVFTRLVPFRAHNADDIVQALAPPTCNDATLARVYSWRTLLRPVHRVGDPDGEWWLSPHKPQTRLVLQPSSMRFFPMRMQQLNAAKQRQEPGSELFELARMHVPPVHVFTPPFWVLLTAEQDDDLFPVTAPAPMLFSYYRTLLLMFVDADWLGEFANYKHIVPAWILEENPDKARQLYIEMMSGVTQPTLSDDDEKLCQQQAEAREQCLKTHQPIPNWVEAESPDEARKQFALIHRVEPLPSDDDALRQMQQGMRRTYDRNKQMAEKEGARRLALEENWGKQMDVMFDRYERLLQLQNRRLYQTLSTTTGDDDHTALHTYAVRLLHVLEAILMAVISVPVKWRQELHTPPQQPPERFHDAANQTYLDETSQRIVQQILLNREHLTSDEGCVPTNEELRKVQNAADYETMLASVIRKLAPTPQ